MIESVLIGIQSLVNFLFLIVVLGTAGFSWWLSTKYRQRHAEFPWKKSGIIVAIEVLVWLVFNIFWRFFMHNWWIVAIVVGVVFVAVIKGRKKRHVI